MRNDSENNVVSSWLLTGIVGTSQQVQEQNFTCEQQHHPSWQDPGEDPGAAEELAGLVTHRHFSTPEKVK